MSNEKTDSFLGTGWSFPPEFKKEKQGVVMVSDVEDINGSLEILFSTKVRERLMHPAYGCDLSQLMFEPVNLSMLTYVEGMIRDAINLYEPRINLLKLNIDFSENEGKLLIEVHYEVRGTNSRFNYVYPFYIEEGTNIG